MEPKLDRVYEAHELEVLPPASDCQSADAVKQVCADIHCRISKLVHDVFAIGHDLHRLKKLLPRGEFGAHIKQEFNWSARTAQNYMNAATEFSGKSEIVSHLPQKLIYELAAPSTPPEVRNEVLSKLEAGENLDPNQIDARVREGRRTWRKQKEEERKAASKLSPEGREKPNSEARRKAAERREEKSKRQRDERDAQEAAEKANAREAVELIKARMEERLPDFVRLVQGSGSYFVEAIRDVCGTDSQSGVV
jgi:hypothetical protein